MIHVLIIEDDPMVQFIHKSYLEKVDPTLIVFEATNIESSKKILEKESIDLILLDIHLEDGNGLQLLSNLRKFKRDIDVILITASKESLLVKESLHLGILDYLIKPFTYDRFEKSLHLFQKKTNQLKHAEIDQAKIDALLQPQHLKSNRENEMDKGLTTETLNLVIDTIKTLNEPFTIQDITEQTKLSHVSIRKYVTYLEKQKQLRSDNIYLKVGRPYKVYYRN